MLTPAQLRRRNALWARLRDGGPGAPNVRAIEFEAALAELSALTGWPRGRVLAGLGLTELGLLGLVEADPAEADLAQGDSL